MNERDDLLIVTLNNINQKIDNLDGKLTNMHEVLTDNTIVLNDHERRSTASENRLTLLEDKDSHRSKKENQFKGFFIYAGLILAALGSIGTVFHYWIQPFLSLGK